MKTGRCAGASGANKEKSVPKHCWGAKTPRCFPSSGSWILTVRNNCTDVVSRIFHTRLVRRPRRVVCTRPRHPVLYRQRWQHSSVSLWSAVPHGWWVLTQGALRVLNCWVSNVLRRNDRVFPHFCQQLVGLLAHRGMGKPQVQNISLNQIEVGLGLGWREARLCGSPFSDVMSFMKSFQKLL